MAKARIAKSSKAFNLHSSEMRRLCLIAGDLRPPVRSGDGKLWLPIQSMTDTTSAIMGMSDQSSRIGWAARTSAGISIDCKIDT